MNFGLGKMRPMGNEHFYKYSHAKNWNDVKRINANHSYRPEIDEKGSPIYIYHQLEHPGNHEGGVESNYPNDYAWGTAWSHWHALKYYYNNMPNLKSFSHLFSRNMPLIVDVDMPKVTNCNLLLFQMNAGNDVIDRDRKIYIKLKNAPTTESFMSSCHVRKNIDVKFYAPISTSIKGFYNSTNWIEPTYTLFEVDAPLVKNADSAFYADIKNAQRENFIEEITISLDEDGNNAFVTNKTVVAKKFATWKNLSSAKDMFTGCRLSKEYGLAVLNDLPTYTDGKDKHQIGMGFSAAYRYDPDVNLALKKVDKDFITPLEQFGYSLPEEVTEDKGWKLSCTWYGGKTTADELINPIFYEKFELDDISLPDGYVRCEYLESDITNKQFLKLNIIPNNNLGFYLIAKQIQKTEGYPIGLANPVQFIPPQIRQDTSYVGSATAWNDVPKDGTIFESFMRFPKDGIVSNDAIIIDNSNSTYTKELPISTNTFSYPLFLFARNNYGAAINSWGGRIYRCKISEGTEIIRDYIPCLDPDGKPCMRDIINGVDYHNQGTGEDFLYKIYEK